MGSRPSMNWLAHLFLSEPTPEFRIGNLLPDLLGPAELRQLPASFWPGLACHRRIDAFTDAHPVVRRSIGRLSRPHRRYGGIIVDMFYDHFLALEWSLYSRVPFETFVHENYAAFATHRAGLPPGAFGVLQRMSTENWLGSYRDVTGLRLALNRIGARLRKPVQLGDAVAELESLRPEFREDFACFFPQLVAHVAAPPG